MDSSASAFKTTLGDWIYRWSHSLLNGVLQNLMDLFLRKQAERTDGLRGRCIPILSSDCPLACTPFFLSHARAHTHTMHACTPAHTPGIPEMNIFYSFFVYLHASWLHPVPPPSHVIPCGRALTLGLLPGTFLQPVSSPAFHLFFPEDCLIRCPPSPGRNTQHSVCVTHTAYVTLSVQGTNIDAMIFHIWYFLESSLETLCRNSVGKSGICHQGR